MNCPHCNVELSAEATARLADESKVAIALEPAPGELFDLKTIGSTLANFAKVLAAVGKEVGAPTLTLLERVECDNGKLTFHCIVCRTGNRKVREVVC
jgi:hypothetical protein